jgi:hypothetical protein
MCRSGKRHAVEPVEASGSEESQGVPTPAPGVPDLLVGVEDDVADPEPPEVIADR